MLTRLKVSGFKNLVDVDVRFGPFTCIAGANATGKSNLFDAIQFLSHLASDTLLNAALSVRSEGGRTTDVRNLFLRAGGAHTQEKSVVTGRRVGEFTWSTRIAICVIPVRMQEAWLLFDETAIKFAAGNRTYPKSLNLPLTGLGQEVCLAEHAWVRWRSFYIDGPDGNVMEWVCHDETAG
jgi:hypothetical protein